MPTYQYACTACDHRFEAVQAFSDAALTECPECQGSLRKVYSSVGVVFKGSGFYRNDSRTSGGGGSAPAKDGAAAKESSTPAKEPAGTPAKESTSTPKPAAASSSSGSGSSGSATSGTAA